MSKTKASDVAQENTSINNQAVAESSSSLAKVDLEKDALAKEQSDGQKNPAQHDQGIEQSSVGSLNTAASQAFNEQPAQQNFAYGNPLGDNSQNQSGYASNQMQPNFQQQGQMQGQQQGSWHTPQQGQPSWGNPNYAQQSMASIMPPMQGYPNGMQGAQGYPYQQMPPPGAYPYVGYPPQGLPSAQRAQGIGATPYMSPSPNMMPHQQGQVVGAGSGVGTGNVAGAEHDVSNLPLLVKSADGKIFVKKPNGQDSQAPSSETSQNAQHASQSTSAAPTGVSAHATPAAPASAAPSTSQPKSQDVKAAKEAPPVEVHAASSSSQTGTVAGNANPQPNMVQPHASMHTVGSGMGGGSGGPMGGGVAMAQAGNFVYTPSSATEKWYDNLGVHILLICVISLVLMIPSSFFSWVLDDRQRNQDYAIDAMTQAWGSAQGLSDPELIIPVMIPAEIEVNGNTSRSKVKMENRYMRPKTTSTNIKLTSEKRYKGNYEATLYTLEVEQTGYFDLEEGYNILNSNSKIEVVDTEEVRLAITVTDNKGIDEIKFLEVDGRRYEAVPSDEFNGFEVMLPREAIFSNTRLKFNLSYMVRGSQSIRFFALSQVSELTINAQGSIPNFTGAFLPREREVNLEERTFSAKYYQNNLSTGQALVTANEFGDRDTSHILIELFDEAGSYVMIERLTKYVLLVIAMTFVTVLAFEIVSKRLISLVQYVVIGVALILFYLVLLSFSEHIGFVMAYILGAVVLSVMISLYVKAAFNSKKQALCLLIMLGAMYAVLFAIVHIEAYALMVGTILLVIMLGIVMYITRHINQKPVKAM